MSHDHLVCVKPDGTRVPIPDVASFARVEGWRHCQLVTDSRPWVVFCHTHAQFEHFCHSAGLSPVEVTRVTHREMVMGIDPRRYQSATLPGFELNKDVLEARREWTNRSDA